ncbi:hypothetical protein DdX_18794 [Ditylenchus destructor]|uniref:Uncharacterized protein n=1 Tax=Ditylenchus destructor TaxID=166010 RepID=A0AAD4QUL8_9BILA|nr:hypothetical protein DdX_18794 [Ditylenchus destructor]
MKGLAGEQAKRGKKGVDPNQIQFIENWMRTNNMLAQSYVMLAVFVAQGDGEVPKAYISVHERGHQVTTLQHVDPNSEGLMYPLLNIYGEHRWHFGRTMNSEQSQQNGKKNSENLLHPEQVTRVESTSPSTAEDEHLTDSLRPCNCRRRNRRQFQG